MPQEASKLLFSLNLHIAGDRRKLRKYFAMQEGDIYRGRSEVLLAYYLHLFGHDRQFARGVDGDLYPVTPDVFDMNNDVFADEDFLALPATHYHHDAISSAAAS
jgi:hypothetical protein